MSIQTSHTSYGLHKKLPRGPIRDRLKEVIGYFWKKFIVENKYSWQVKQGTIRISNSRIARVKRGKFRKTVSTIIQQLGDDGGLSNVINRHLTRIRGSDDGVYRLILNKVNQMTESAHTLVEFESYSSLPEFRLPRECNASEATAGFHAFLRQIQPTIADYQVQTHRNTTENDTKGEWWEILAQTPELNASMAGLGHVKGTGNTLHKPVIVKYLTLFNPWSKAPTLKEKRPARPRWSLQADAILLERKRLHPKTKVGRGPKDRIPRYE